MKRTGLAGAAATRVGRIALAVICVGMGAAAVPPRSAAQVPAWQEIGPQNVGGRVTAIAVVSTQPARIVVGTPAGGVWESTDAALTWHPLTMWLAATPLSALATDAADPTRLFAGTGTVSDTGAVTGGIGLLRTTDGGATWQFAGAAGKGSYISSILIWPGEPQRVLVGTDLDVQLSVDGGVTFTPVLEGEAVSALVRDPMQANVVFASTRRGLQRSSDRGATWASVSAWPLLATDTFGAGVTSLALASHTPGLLYAAVQVLGTLNQTDRALLLRSTDGGVTFTHLQTPAAFCPGADTCGFAQTLAIDPADDTRLLLGGEALLVSRNAGDTWDLIPGLNGVHGISIVTGHTYATGRFGVAELNTPWTSAALKNQGLAVTGILTLDASPEAEPRLLASTEDSGTLLQTNSTPWRVVFGPGERSGPSRFDPFMPQRLVASRPGGLLYRSDDAGETFQAVQDGLDLSQPALRIAPLEASPVEPGLWYTGRMQMFSSADGAGTWLDYRPVGFPEIATIAPSPVVAGRVYFGTTSGGALYKADGTTTEQLVVTTDPNMRITSVFLDPLAQNALYVTGTDTRTQFGRIFKSADFGVNWIDVSPSALGPTTSLVKDRFGALYVGARDGVWRSANGGYSWTPFVNRLFAGGVNALRIAGGSIFAGTTGRGVFRITEQELVSLESLPNRVTFLVDGQEVTTPYLVHWPPGSVHTITPVLRDTSDTREEFVAWSDGGTQSRTLTAPSGNGWLLAAIRRSFQLQTTADAGGSITRAPASPDGFYPERSFVTLVPVPDDNHRFTEFGGDVSGDDGLVGYALMDRPRHVSATFAALQMSVSSQPAGVSLLVDGQNTAMPATFQWSAGSTHTVSAPEYVGTSEDAPVLAFDSWSDLRGRSHTLTMSRESFVTDLTARYIDTVRGVTVPAGATRTIVTTGQGDAPRMAALTVRERSAGDIVPTSLQLVRGRVDGVTVHELVLVPSEPRAWTTVHLEQDLDGVNGRARLAFFNPSAADATVGILLRNAAGVPLAAKTDAIRVPAGAHVTAWLDEVLLLPRAFECLVSLIADRPLVTSVHSISGNVRASTRLDPILVSPFIAGDQGVSVDPRVQVALLTAETTHTLVLANTGFSPLAGTVTFHDETGAPLAVPLATGTSSSVAYQLPAGGYLRLALNDLAVPALQTLQIRVQPSPGQPAPILQLHAARTAGEAQGLPVVLPRTVPPSQAARSFRLPINRAMRETGAVFTNTSIFPVSLVLRLLDRDGQQLIQATRQIVPGQQVLWSSEALLGAVSDSFQGAVAIAADIPVHGVGFLRFANERGEEIVAGYPLPTDAAPLVMSPLAIDGDSWRSEWWFSNAGAVEARATLDFRGTAGRTIHFPLQ